MKRKEFKGKERELFANASKKILDLLEQESKDLKAEISKTDFILNVIYLAAVNQIGRSVLENGGGEIELLKSAGFFSAKMMEEVGDYSGEILKAIIGEVKQPANLHIIRNDQNK